MSANPTRSNWPRGRRSTPAGGDAPTVAHGLRALSREPYGLAIEPTTTKFAGRRWERMIAAAAPADDLTTVRAVVANDTIAPGRLFAPDRAEAQDLIVAEPRARSSMSWVVAVALGLFAVGIASHAIWIGRSDATADTPTAAITLTHETSSAPRAAAVATQQLASSPGASARVTIARRAAPSSSSSRVLNPIAEAVLAARDAPVADEPTAAANEDAVIAELLAELDTPAPTSHRASQSHAHTRARRHHRLAHAAHPRRALHGIPPNPFD